MKRKSTLKRVLCYIEGYRLYLLASILLAVLTVALTLYAPILTGDAIDYMMGKGAVDFAALLKLLTKLGVIIGSTSVFQWLMNLCNNHITYKVVMDVRTEAFDHMQDLPLSYIDSHPQGDIVSRLIADIDQFSDGLLMGFTQLFTGVMTILGTLLFMLSVNVGITLVVVCITPLSLLVASFIARRTHSMFKLQSETRGELTGLIDEMVGNQKVVKAFGHEEEAIAQFDAINRQLQKHSLRAIFYSSITNPATRFVNSMVYAGVGVAGAFAAIRGGLSVGQLSCFLSYANQYTKPFNEISGVVTELQNALACAERVFDFIDQEPMSADPADGPYREGRGQRGSGTCRVFLYEGQRADQEPESACKARPENRHRGSHRLRQEYAYQSADAFLRRGRRLHFCGRNAHSGADPGKSAAAVRYGIAGDLAEVRDGSRQHFLWKAGRHRGRDYRGSEGLPRPQLYPASAEGL